MSFLYNSRMARLSVNVNKIATLRNARGKDLPNVLEESLKIIQFGAEGITVHPRPDGRHIRWPDVFELKQQINVELNIEGYPENQFIEKVLQVKPAQCTLVPDPPDVLTSNAGWKLKDNEELLTRVVKTLKDNKVRVSLFVDPNEIEMQELLSFRDMGVDRVELYTEAYADSYKTNNYEGEISAYQKCAKLADSMGMKVNAGHDLNLDNLTYFSQNIPELTEVSIGHALVCDALNYGWQTTIQKYLDCLK